MTLDPYDTGWVLGVDVACSCGWRREQVESPGAAWAAEQAHHREWASEAPVPAYGTVVKITWNRSRSL